METGTKRILGAMAMENESPPGIRQMYLRKIGQQACRLSMLSLAQRVELPLRGFLTLREQS